ncbi:MAG: NRAMP family divalent metal transporter [Sulfurifustis sp.]
MRATKASRRPAAPPAGRSPKAGGRFRELLRKLGPGLITGAADDDPSGIATYSQGGALVGFGALWTLLFTYPLMVGIQVVSARLGCVTGRGLAANIRRSYPVWFLYLLVGLLVFANTVNIAADIAAMGDAAELVTGAPSAVYEIGFAAFSLILQIFVPYGRYVRILKWLTLALLAYVAVLFVVEIPWIDVARQALIPQNFADGEYVPIIVGIFGTTISPYLFFWQAAQEVEEQRNGHGDRPLRRDSATARRHLRRIKIDTYIGMAFSNLIAFIIMLSTAVTLHAQGVHDIETSAQAAEALRPIAGDFAFQMFALGIVGTGLLAVPVLAGSAAYAVAEALRWPAGLDLKPGAAKGFYTIIAVSTLLGVAFDFSSVAPMKALLAAAIVNGVIAVPMMAVLMRMAADRHVMGSFAITRRLKVLGWSATVVMAAMAVLLVWTLLRG